MTKTILITGATDGIGLETAKLLVSAGHHVLLHGRNSDKLEQLITTLSTLSRTSKLESYVADLSDLANVEALARAVIDKHDTLDVLVNNAGVFKTPYPITEAGFDVRFVVNTIAPYLLTQCLLPLLGQGSRVVNVSSAAQASVDLQALRGERRLPDSAAYAQSKLALMMWSHRLARVHQNPMIVSVNPGSMLGSKMVKEGFGVAGGDLQIGANILKRAALEDAFADASGKYFDNDSGRFAPPHPDGLNVQKCQRLVETLEVVLAKHTQ
ncbi:MAG: SDR family NAD(P)-dependent oxidoreductase [Deinococcota bacterium]